MKTSPFFRLPPPDMVRDVLSPVSARYPYHDDDECCLGQEVKRSGQWQNYEPRQVAETRVRCPICRGLSQVGK
jgi:hypothetical protein